MHKWRATNSAFGPRFSQWLTIDGVGLTFLMEEHAAPYLANGQLVRVLEDWCELPMRRWRFGP